MKNIYKLETTHGYAYELNLNRNTFTVRDHGRKFFEAQTLAHKLNMYGNKIQNIELDLNLASSCLVDIHKKSIKKIIEEVKHDNE